MQLFICVRVSAYICLSYLNVYTRHTIRIPYEAHACLQLLQNIIDFNIFACSLGQVEVPRVDVRAKILEKPDRYIAHADQRGANCPQDRLFHRAEHSALRGGRFDFFLLFLKKAPSFEAREAHRY